MINEKNVRIGNRVLCGIMKEPVLVNSIDFDRRDRWLINKIPVAEFKPIPLDATWLERAGYIKSSLEAYKHSCGVWLNVKDEGVFYIYGMRSDRYIKFVHELQNAVYILTGEELTFKTNEGGERQHGK